jgi:hypothetical protein
MQGDRHKFMRYTGADDQTTTKHGQVTHLCSPMIRPPTWPVRPPALGTEALGHVSGTHGRVRVTTAKLSASTGTWPKAMHKGRTVKSNTPPQFDRRCLATLENIQTRAKLGEDRCW